MKSVLRVTELVKVFEEIQKRPEKIFEMMREKMKEKNYFFRDQTQNA